MKRASTASFILTLKLNTSKRQDKVLNDRFFAAWKIRNQIAKYASKQLHKLNMDKQYKELLKQPKSDARDDALKVIRQAYDLSEAGLQSWAKLLQHTYRRFVDSNTVQKIATQVWQGVSACMFGKGKEIHVCRYESFDSVEGKTNKQGIKYRNGYIDWLGEHFAVQIRHDDNYAKEALKNKVKYCRIVRKPVGTRYHYYVQLIIEGTPPNKHNFLPGGAVGIDQGISTEAVVTDEQCILTEIAPERKDIANKVSDVQRKMDSSRRTNNPENYNPDGTVKTGRKQWKKSKRYKRLQIKNASLRRKNAAYVKQKEEEFANLILETCGSDIISEKMNYKALQKRKPKGKFSFGRPLATHAPARFLDILNRKLGYIGKEIFFVNTKEYKASQYNHITDTYTKIKLSVRTKTIGVDKVQRDLYSAFLLLCAEDDRKPDRQLCEDLFPQFIVNQAQCISALKASNKAYPSSFGLKDFA